MKNFRNALRCFFADEDGPTAIEYAFLLALIVAVCISSVNILANNTGQSFNESSEAITNAFSN